MVQCMAASTKSGPPQSIAMPVFLAGFALALAGLWFGYPGFLGLWVCLIAVGLTEPSPEMTGPKKGRSREPIDDGEQAALDAARWKQNLKTSCLGGGIADSVWPVQTSLVLGLAAAAVVFCLPIGLPVAVPGHQLNHLAWGGIEAAAVLLSATGYASSRRKIAGSPGVTVLDLVKLGWAKGLLWTVLGGLLGAATGVGTYAVLYVSAALDVPHRAGWVAVCTVLGALAAPITAVRAAALRDWKDLCDQRAEWAERWPLAKLDPAPVLTRAEQLGGLRVNHFDLLGGKTFTDIATLVVKGTFSGVMPSGVSLYIMAEPMTVKGQPQPGTVHATKIVLVQSEEWPDVSSPETPANVRETAVAAALMTTGMSRFMAPILPGETDQISDDETSAAFCTGLIWPQGSQADAIRCQPGPGTAVTGGLLGDALLDSAANNGNGQIVYGNLSADMSEGAQAKIVELATEDDWTSCWTENATLGTKTAPPVMQGNGTSSSAKLGSATITNSVFAVRGGIDATKMFSPAMSRALASSMTRSDRLPDGIHTISAYIDPRTGRKGDRHPQAIRVIGTKGRIPGTPQQMRVERGSKVNEWLMTGWLNTAFDLNRQPRPEIVGLKCLTNSSSRESLWDVDLRLYTMSFSDLRGFAERIRQSLGVDWLRVEESADGARMVFGCRPTQRNLTNRGDMERLQRLDWAQAFFDAKVVSSSGQTPEVVEVGVAPRNADVAIIDFELPAGLGFADVSKQIDKLKTATGNEFLELRRIPGKANGVRAMSCSHDPMPKSVPFDAEQIAAEPGSGLLFATGVDGSPESFDVKEDPHLLILGGSGSGKLLPDETVVPVPVQPRFPDGVARHGDLQVGDLVHTPDGTSRVVKVHPRIDDHPMLRVGFDDGRELVMGANHMLRVSTADSRAQASLRTPATIERSRALSERARLTGVGVGANLASAAAMCGLSEQQLIDAGLWETAHFARVPGQQVVRSVRADLLADVADHEDFPFGGAGDLRTAVADVGLWVPLADAAAILHRAPCADDEQVDRVERLVAEHGLPTARLDASRVEAVFTVAEALSIAADLTLNGPVCRIMTAKQVYLALAQRETGLRLDGGPGIVSAEVVDSVPGRCISIDDPRSIYLAGDFIPTHNSAAICTLTAAGMVRGWEWHYIDAIKKCADFRPLEPWASSMSTDIFEGVAAITGIYAEVERRKDLNGQFGVTGCKDLPEGHKVHQIGIVIDEFASLMMTETVDTRPLDDPIAEAGRQDLLIRNKAARQIAFYVKKIAQEARSVNVTLVLAAQTLDATTLEKMGMKGLKTNMSSLLLGKTSDGSRRSALKAPDEAQKLGDEAKNGRGLFECSRHNAEALQVWWSHPTEMAEKVGRFRQPLAAEEKLDVEKYMTLRPSTGPVVQDVAVEVLSTEAEEVIEVDAAELLGDLDFGSLDFGELAAEGGTPEVEAGAVASSDVESTEDPEPEEAPALDWGSPVEDSEPEPEPAEDPEPEPVFPSIAEPAEDPEPEPEPALDWGTVEVPATEAPVLDWGSGPSPQTPVLDWTAAEKLPAPPAEPEMWTTAVMPEVDTSYYS